MTVLCSTETLMELDYSEQEQEQPSTDTMCFILTLQTGFHMIHSSLLCSSMLSHLHLTEVMWKTVCAETDTTVATNSSASRQILRLLTVTI